MDIFRIRGIFLFIIAFLNLILALIIWSKAKNDKAKIWLGVTALSSGLYAFSCGGTYFFWQPYSISSIYWWRATWLGVLIIPAFNVFTYYLTNDTKRLKLKALLFYLGAFIIIFLAFTTDLFLKTALVNDFNITGLAGRLDFVGRFYILFGLAVALANLYKRYIKSNGREKLQLKYFLLGTIMFVASGIITVSIIPLVTGESPYYDIPVFFSFVWVLFIIYATLRYNLFDIRVFAKELLTFGVWILLFIRTIFSASFQDLTLNIALSILLTILGVLFLRSVYKEAELNKKLLEETQKSLDFERRLKETYAEIAEKEIKSKYFGNEP